MTGRILITRPEEDARPLADALHQRGIATLLEPLLAIRTLPEMAAPLAEDLAGIQAILFTSANGVRAFADLSSRRDIGVLAVGDATAAAARAAGFSAVESAGGDVNALADLARRRLKPAGGPLFHAAGSAVAGDLARLLSEAGFTLRRRMLYESRPADAFTLESRAALLAGEIGQVVLFSPRTAATFVKLAQGAALDCRRMTALCLSPAVAEAAGALSWRAIRIAAHPDLSSMLALIDSPAPAKEPPAPPIPDAPKPERTMPETPPSSPPPRSSPPPGSAPLSPPPASSPTVVRRGGSPILAGLVGAILAAAIVLGLARFAPGMLGLAAPAANNDTAALRQQLTDVSSRLGALEQKVAALPPPADTGALSDQIKAIQADVAALKSAGPGNGVLPAEISGLPQRLSDLEGRIAALEQRPAGSGGDAAALEAIRADLAALEARLKNAEAATGDIAGLKQSLAELSPAGGKSGNAAAGMALSLGEVERLIESGKPYAPALASLQGFAAGDPALLAAISPSLGVLQASAGKGVPTLAQLQASFPAMAEALSRAASSAAENVSPDASFGERVLARLSSLVSIRPVGDNVQGDDPLARLARAEDAIHRGDVAAAAGELSALPAGPTADAARPWLDQAKARLDAQAAFDKLQADAIAALAKPAGGQ